jgi:hypothetical protein
MPGAQIVEADGVARRDVLALSMPAELRQSGPARKGGMHSVRSRALTGGVHERLPRGPVSGQHRLWATGGPEFATTVVATGSGYEKRIVNWSEARGRWAVASGLKKQGRSTS